MRGASKQMKSPPTRREVLASAAAIAAAAAVPALPAAPTRVFKAPNQAMTVGKDVRIRPIFTRGVRALDRAARELALRRAHLKADNSTSSLPALPP